MGLVLAGAGHVHGLLIAFWQAHPKRRPPGSITLVSRQAVLVYSGLLPAVVAGLVPASAARIPLRLACRTLGIRWVRGEIIGLNPVTHGLHLADGRCLTYDRLSLDVGSVTASVEAGELPLRPLEAAVPQLLAWAADPVRAPSPLRLRGGGASAVELAFALRARGLCSRMVLRSPALHLGSAAADQAVKQWLAAAGIALEPGPRPTTPAQLACTGNRAPAWLAAAGLPVDHTTGRVLTEATLEVRGWPGLFAAGDCALLPEAPRPPAGVWAVQAVPVLAANLRRGGGPGQRPLQRWTPPRQALQLLGDGGAVDGRPRALALWGPWCLGPWAVLWWLKLALDHRFVRRLRHRPQLHRTRPRSNNASAA
ncbi:MAG: hypothetical protein VKN13_06610 [Cyanobacteriota bacterium]|nr:hypothetical protein [Cyanobacteriota bacterium]